MVAYDLDILDVIWVHLHVLEVEFICPDIPEEGHVEVNLHVLQNQSWSFDDRDHAVLDDR